MSDLKPCPFCGNADVKPYRSGSDNHYVECPQCGTFGPDCESRQEAIDTWNARTEVQSAISAAVQAEREAIIQFAEYAERVAREKSGEHWEGRSCASFAIANFVRSRGPAVVCQECNGKRWHEYQNPLTGEITNRTPCAACNGAEEVPGPAPAVDVMAPPPDAAIVERCARIAEEPSGYWTIGSERRPYWDGNEKAKAIRALATPTRKEND